MNLVISPGRAVWPRVVLIVRLAICWRLSLYTPIRLREAVVGLLSLLRNEGGQRTDLASSDDAGAA